MIKENSSQPRFNDLSFLALFMHCPLPFRFIAGLAAGLMLGLPGAQGTDLFRATGAMSEARGSHTATLLRDGKVLVIGGDNSTDALNGAEIYDPATESWGPTRALSTARTYHTATRLADGKVLVTGGTVTVPRYDNTVYGLASAEVYDPLTRTWHGTGPMQAGRAGHTATLLPDGRVLVTGGYKSNEAAGGYTSSFTGVTSAELYDPATGTWSSAGALVAARIGHTATLLPTGKVLIVGGALDYKFATVTELFDPATSTWQTTGPTSDSYTYHTATLLPSGKVMVTGGNGSVQTELYDPATGTWTTSTAADQGRSNHTATVMPGGRVLVTGGVASASADRALASTTVFDPATATWSTACSLRKGRNNHTATLLPNGLLLIAGGFDNLYGATSSAELLAPGHVGGTSYNGLVVPWYVSDTPVKDQGFLSITLQDNLAFTGKLSVNAKSYPLTGQFDSTGAAHLGPHQDLELTLETSAVKLPSLTLDLQLDLGFPTVDAKVTGNLVWYQDDGSIATLSTVDADRTYFDGRQQDTSVPASYLGKGYADGIYNVILPWMNPPLNGYLTTDYPSGTGFGTARVTRAGVVTFAALLADGTAMTAATALVRHGGDTSSLYVSTAPPRISFPLFSQLYGRQGLVSARVNFDFSVGYSEISVKPWQNQYGNSNGNDFALWVRPAMNKAPHYASGWPSAVAVDLMGSHFVVTPGQSLLAPFPGQPFTVPNVNGNVGYFIQSDSGFMWEGTVNVNSSDKMRKAIPTDQDVVFSIDRRTGMFSGRFRHPYGGLVPFQGIIYQSSVSTDGRGFYLNNSSVKNFDGQGGEVTLQPQ